jgi:archaellum component FlaC
MQTRLNELEQSTTNGFENVKNSAIGYEALMDNNDKLLTSQIDKMDKFTRRSKTRLNNQMNTLTNTANVVGGQVRLAESSLEKQIRKLGDAVENLMQSATITESSVRNISSELSGLTNKFNSEIKEFATGVVGELNTVSGVANTTLENTRTAAGAFGESVRAMAIGVRETLMEMNTAHTQLSGQSENLIKMTRQTTSQLEPLSELIERYYITLPDLTDGSAMMEKIVATMTEQIDRLKQVVNESVVGVSESSQKLENLSGRSRQQMIDLMSDYAKAVDTMQTLNKQMMVARATAPMDAIKAASAPTFGHISSQDFLKQAERVLDKMHEQSLDLTRAIGAEIPDTIWKKYHAGDKTIFSKWLAKMLVAADKKQVKSLLKSDSVFRSQRTQFVRSFAKIIANAQNADNASALIDTLQKTDLGIVYMALRDDV